MTLTNVNAEERISPHGRMRNAECFQRELFAPDTQAYLSSFKRDLNEARKTTPSNLCVSKRYFSTGRKVCAKQL